MCSSQGEKGCEKPFPLWKGGSLRRPPAWEKGLRSLLSGRGAPEEGAPLNREHKGWCFRGRHRVLPPSTLCISSYICMYIVNVDECKVIVRAKGA